MEKFHALIWRTINFNESIIKNIFHKVTIFDEDSLRDISKFQNKFDVIILDLNHILNEEQKIFLINAEVKEKTPLLYYCQSKEKAILENKKSWQIILSDYTDREIRLTLELAIYKTEVDRELLEYSYQNESAKGKIESQAADMMQMAEKLAILQDQEKRLSQSKSNFIKQIMFQLASGMNSILGLTQVLQMGELKSEQREVVNEIQFANECLVNQIQNVLTLSSYENKKIAFSRSEFDIQSKINSICELFKKNTNRNGLVISAQNIDLDGYWETYQDALQIILFNLINFSMQCLTKKKEVLSIIFKQNHKKDGLFLNCSIQIPLSFIPMFMEKARKQTGTFTQKIPYEIFEKEESFIFVSEIILEAIGGKLVYQYEKEILEIEFDMPITFKRKRETAKQTSKIIKVLFVDDNELSRQIGFIIFNKLNCSVDIVENGFFALEKLKANKYDIVMMDCNMPIMNGFEATRLVRSGKVCQINQNTPIIALTANVFTEDKEKCLAVGMNDFLGKPIRIDNVKEMLGKWT